MRGREIVNCLRGIKRIFGDEVHLWVLASQYEHSPTKPQKRLKREKLFVEIERKKKSPPQAHTRYEMRV